MSKPSNKVGIALGAGSSRGLAHLGVLKVLKEASIPITAVAGTSIGSIFGALYAANYNLDFLIKMVDEFKQQHFYDLTVPRMGLIKGEKIEEFLKLITKGLTFEDLDLPLYVVAVDLLKSEEVVYSSGPIYKALRASISIPGVFHPQKIDDKLLVDGAVLNRLPVNVLKDQGLDVVIGVEVKYGGMQGEPKKTNNIFDVLLYSMDFMQLGSVKSSYKDADILIQPNLSHIKPTRFDDAKECITIGIEEARRNLPKIKEFIGKV